MELVLAAAGVDAGVLEPLSPEDVVPVPADSAVDVEVEEAEDVLLALPPRLSVL